MNRSAPNSVSQHPKVAEQHLTRTAFVYIRQSSQGQVLRNKESQVNQYQLVDRPQQLGWDRERIRVIDVDLGVSGKECRALGSRNWWRNCRGTWGSSSGTRSRGLPATIATGIICSTWQPSSTP